MARRLDEPFVRRGQRAEELRTHLELYRYRVRGVQRMPDQGRRKPLLEHEAAERERLATELEERANRMRAFGQGGDQSRRETIWTASRIVVALGQLAGILGHTPTMAELDGCSRTEWPSSARVRIVFGGWNAALAAAGLALNATDRARRRVWSDEQILRAIRDAAAAGDGGQRPFREGRRRPWLTTITIRFGSWSVAESLALGSERKVTGGLWP